MVSWIVASHGTFFIGFIITFFTLAFICGMMGADKLGWLFAFIAIGAIVIPIAMDFIGGVFSNFWTGLLATIIIMSMFSKGTFWEKMFVLGMAYRATETICDKLNKK